MADQTGGIAVKEQNINSSVAGFIKSNYTNDKLAENLSSPYLLSLSEFKEKKYYLPSTDKDFWLSDTGGNYGLTYRAYAKTSNGLDKNFLRVYGSLNGRYFNGNLAYGPYAWTCNAQLDKMETTGWRFDPSSTKSITWYVRKASKALFNSGDDVWNNPYLMSSGSEGSLKYAKTQTKKMINDYNYRFYGVYRNGQIVPAVNVSSI